MALYPRIFLAVTLLAYAATSASSNGPSVVSIGQSNPGTVDTVDIVRAIDPQTAVTTIPTTSTGSRVLGGASLQPNTGALGLPLTATNLGGPQLGQRPLEPSLPRVVRQPITR